MVWEALVLPLTWDSSEARPKSWDAQQATHSGPLSFSSFPCLSPFCTPSPVLSGSISAIFCLSQTLVSGSLTGGPNLKPRVEGLMNMVGGAKLPC